MKLKEALEECEVRAKNALTSSKQWRIENKEGKCPVSLGPFVPTRGNNTYIASVGTTLISVPMKIDKDRYEVLPISMDDYEASDYQVIDLKWGEK